EGGSQNFAPDTRGEIAPLGGAMVLVRGARRPRTSFFLRAETFFNVATKIDDIAEGIHDSYGGSSLHERSHGEGFLALALHRFRPHGFYAVDEHEAPLSPPGHVTLAR